MGEITLRKALDDYKTVYMPYRNFAERTRVEYQNDLKDFINYLGRSGINDVGSLGLPIIERYVAHLEEKGFASPTRKRKVVAIRSFLSFLYQYGYITSNIGKKVTVPFTQYPYPTFLTQSEIDKLRSVCSNNPRDAAIIELLLQTGIKLSELVHLTVNDIEFDESGKAHEVMQVVGIKDRIIPLNTKASEALKRYLGTRTDNENSTLFQNRFGESLGESGVQKMLRRYRKRTGIGRANAQILRHTFGTHHFTKGTDPKTVQEVMGYKDPRSTSIYISTAQELIKKELENHAL